MMRLDLLRHGDTGRAGYLDGRTDYPLSDVGLQQMAQQTASGGWSLIVASPLMRARAPAENLAGRLLCGIAIDPDWAELDFGRWEGRHRSDIEADASDRQLLRAYYDNPCAAHPPDGENWIDLTTRVHRAVQNTYDLSEGQRTLVITHAGPMRAALSLILGMPLGALWSIRLSYATRIGLEVGRSDDGNLWGELVEVVQA